MNLKILHSLSQTGIRKMKKKTRLALVGCGRRGMNIGKIFAKHPDCEVTAIYDIYPNCMDNAVKQFSTARKVKSFDDILTKGWVDAVFLACDPTGQVNLACQAMKAGLHVCTEVPAAFTLQECRDLIRTVRETGRVYLVLEQTRYWGFIQHWANMNRNGEFGQIAFAQGEYIHYKRDWGCWTDPSTGDIFSPFDRPGDRELIPTWRHHVLGQPIYYLPHTLSPLLKVLDDRVVSVSCVGTKRPSYAFREEDVELPWTDLQYALMHTEKGTILMAGAGFSMPHINRGELASHWYDVRGTKACVEAPRCADDAFRVWRRGEKSFSTQDVSSIPLDATQIDINSGHGGADARPVWNFLHAVRSGEPLEFDVYRAVETAVPAILAAESARLNGERLPVPDLRDE